MKKLLLLGLLSGCMSDGFAATVYGGGSTSAGGGADIQSFTAGAGSYTWTKPSSGTYTLAVMITPGGAGGSGGYGTSDSGGGGGGSGFVLYSHFLLSALGATETVVLTAPTGGLTKATAGDGNLGSDPGETSFGVAGNNLLRFDGTTAFNGAGGTNGAGTGGTSLYSSNTVLMGQFSPVNGISGGAGDDTVAGANASSSLDREVGPVTVVLPTAGGGGGGTNGGANFTNGGDSGAQLINANNGSSAGTIQSGKTGASTDTGGGTPGAAGGINAAGTNGRMFIYGGTGGSGGAGGEGGVDNGGAGGDGGNCGGGGGGGGSSESGATGSGVGGNGGASCIFVITY